MPGSKDSNIVKIAVEMKGGSAQLIEFDQKRPLAAIIQDLCSVWSVADPEQYSLQFSDAAQNYITEKNRNEIKNGSILRLTFSPTKTAQEILDKLNSECKLEEKVEALKQLAKLAADNTFALEFINKQGLSLLVNLIEDGTYTGEPLSHTLTAFVEIMDHGNISWDILEPKFIIKVVSYVNQAGAQPIKTPRASLSILESLVLNSTEKYPLVDKEVTLPNLIMHLQSNDSELQQNAIALINALFLKAEDPKRKAIAATLSSRPIRNVILNNIIQGPRPIGAEMAHQLYVLQTLLLNLLEERMMTKIDPQDQDATGKIIELRKIAFENDSDGGGVPTRRQGGFAKDYKKLGFKNHLDPAADFMETPPGMLALENMVYFARFHTDNYTKVVLENSCRSDEHECPFGRTSIELTKLLCDILKIGEPPSEQNLTYYPMFFNHDHPFEECFCICIVLLNKTWKEMRATTEDLIKVFGVVKEQISRALSTSSSTLDKFRAKLATLTYSEITNLWQQERSNREEWESQARPIVELREQITPQIMELIEQQRLGILVEGTLFTKYNTKGQRIKDKFWYCRLSPNHKVFHHGDCDESTIPTLDELPNKVPVIDIKALVTGKECPHMKDVKGKKSTCSLAFSLMLDSEPGWINFVAPNERVFDCWSDGINSLLGNPMTSKETKQDLEILLSMDIKLRLLDTEGVKIPENPPPIPKDPPNYDFCYDFK